MYLSLRVRSSARDLIVDIAGDVDMNSGPWLEDSLLRFLRISGTCVLADLSGVTFIDCAGLRMLITTCRTAEVHASALRLTYLSPQVRRLADLTGLREALPLAVPREGRVLPERTGQLTAPSGRLTPATGGADTAGLHGRRFRAAALVLWCSGAPGRAVSRPGTRGLTAVTEPAAQQVPSPIRPGTVTPVEAPRSVCIPSGDILPAAPTVCSGKGWPCTSPNPLVR